MFFAAVALLASTSFAQPGMARRINGDASAHMMFRPGQTVQTTQSMPALMSKGMTKDVTVSNFPWTEDFETGTAPAGFTFIDNNNDSYGWEVSNFGTTANGHDGSTYVIASASYINNVGALTPDNWMVLPSFEIPANASNFELSWYEKGQDASYSAEKYSVYICTTGRTVTDFTATTAVLTSTTTGNWLKKTVSLDTYAGQTINIAFRHHNVTDMYYLDIDDIRVGGPSVPEVSISGPTNVEMNTTATFIASGAATFVWSIDGTTQAATGDTLTYTFTTTGIHSVVAEATNNVGTGSDTLLVNVFSCSEAITAMPWEESFEGVTDCWNYVFGVHGSDSIYLYNDGTYAHSGDKFLTFKTGTTPGDGWAISPIVTLPATGLYTLSYYTVMSNRNGNRNHLQVFVSTTASTDTADFNMIYDDSVLCTSGYERRVVNMNTYTGETIRIAFRNVSDTGTYLLQLDDIRLGAMELPELTLAGSNNVRINIPTTYTTTSDMNTIEWNVDGTVQTETGNTLTYTFTSVGTHTVIASATNAAGTTSDTIDVTVFDCPNVTTFPYTMGFEDNENTGCYMFIDADGDNHNWMIAEEKGINESNAMASYSYSSGALTPDDWMILPVMDLPATATDFLLTWYDKAYSANYADDYYSVYVCTTGMDTTNFLATTPVYSGTTPATWTKHGADLSAYAGQTVYIAFRHYNCEDQWAMLLDNLRIGSMEAPEVSLAGADSVRTNEPVTYTANSDANTFKWYVDNNEISGETAATFTYTFTTAGSHTVKVEAINSVGNAFDQMTVMAIECVLQNLPFVPDFTSGEFDFCWDVNPSDGWAIGQLQSGDYVLYSQAIIDYGFFQIPLDPDNWLITPPLTMNTPGNYHVKYNIYGDNDHYTLYLIQGDNQIVLHSETLNSDNALEPRDIEIPATISGTFKVALRHHESEDGYQLIVEGFKIVDPAGIDAINTANVAIYPNPAYDVLNIEGDGIQMVEMFDMNGRNVLTSMTTGQISLTSLVNGVYVVRVTTDNGIRTEKIVKK